MHCDVQSLWPQMLSVGQEVNLLSDDNGSNNHATIVIEYYSIYCVDRCILFSAAQRDKLRVQLSASSLQRMSVKRSHDKN